LNASQKRVIALFIAIQMLLCVSCSVPSGNKSEAKAAEYKAAELTDLQRTYLNFLPELPLGKGTEYDYSGFKSADTTQEVFNLDEGDSNTCAFAFDRQRYAYIGCNITPARIIKYDMVEMKRVSSIDLPAGENRDQCRVAALIAINPDTIIHASYTNPCVFTKIDTKTMTITGTLQGEEEQYNDKFIRGMTYDGTYVYAATDASPSKIIKIDPNTMTKVDDVAFDTADLSGIFAITICGNYLVGACCRSENEEAKIFRLDLNDLHKEPDTITVPGFVNYHSICTDGQSVYAATDSNPIQVAKVNVLSQKLEYVAGFTGTTDEEAGNFSILYNGTDVIVGTWQLDSSIKDKLIKLNTEDLSRKDTLVTPCKFPADLMYVAPYIYTSCDKPTGVVMRLKF
jgi:hypothetical protein